MKSQLYTGQVYHQRLQPKQHHFNYSITMLWLDLDEILLLDRTSKFWSFSRFNLAWWRRGDYFPDYQGNLKTIVQTYFAEKQVKIDKIFLLTHPRYFGIGFNPISLYYGYDESQQLKAIIAEVTNTPWLERHYYFLPVNKEKYNCTVLQKAFHVSPFLPMDLIYQFTFNQPQEKLFFHMKISNQQQQNIFNAGVNLSARPITSQALNQLLYRFPWQTVKIITGIYWQALKLWWKKIPFHQHP